MFRAATFLCVILLAGLVAGPFDLSNINPMESEMRTSRTTEDAVLGGGCFWCVEAIFQSIIGVGKVESGYAGGVIPNPTYEQVSAGASGHAEVARVTFDSSVISYAEILEIFFHAHDPTTINRQGNDVGTQYRSIILFNSAAQKQTALDMIGKIEQSKLWSSKIVTEVKALDQFYPAENYHQNYYKNHSTQPYCSIVIAPKLQKIYKEFAGRIKPKS